MHLKKGFSKKIEAGYTKLKMPWHPYANQGWVQEHRWIFEKKLRRFLHPNEIVHHINEDKSDNRIENLRLYPSKSIHKALHNKTYSFDDDYWTDFLEDIFGVNKIISGPEFLVGEPKYAVT